jgi:choice-of-anchor B domain-containing protein
MNAALPVRPAVHVLVVASLVFSSTEASRSQPNGISLVHNFYQPHGQSSDTPPVRFNSCWGYVAPDGREYALLGTYTGTAIIDITDSANVHEIVHISGPTSIWREMRTWGTYAYVVSEGGGGTQILDLSQLPDTAWRVTSFTHTNGSRNTSRAHSIGIYDGYMYLNGCVQWSPGGIVMFNLNNPVAPGYEGAYTQRYIHDSYVRNDTIFAAAIYNGGGVDIIDARVRTSPSVITRITYTGSGTHNTWLTKDGHYVLSTDEIGSTAKNLKIWNITGLPSPPSTPSAQYAYTPTDIVHNVTVRGNYAYVAWYTAGFVAVDISSPASPQTVGWYDTYPGASGTYDGVWAVYPFFPSGRIIASDMQTGLYVFRFSNLAPRRAVQLHVPSNLDTISTQSSLPFRWSLAADKDQDPHFYELVVTGPGVNLTVSVEDTEYVLPSLAPFQQGEMYSWYVRTRDEATNVPSADTFQFAFVPVAQYLVAGGWNAISLPLVVPDPRKSTVYPTSTSDAFAFLSEQGYVTRDTIEGGTGYWLKFGNDHNITITGNPATLDSIEMRAGWNLIGSIGSPIPVDDIIQIPAGIVQSSFFGYQGMYSASDTVSPGKAYWVKVGQNGRLVMSSGSLRP